MTNKILNITLCSLLLLFSSCAYLEVREKGIVSEDELFDNTTGFHSAMYGVYSSMANSKTYGRELTYGFIEEICYPYYNVINDTLKKTIGHDYLSSEVRHKIDNIWNTSYESISYINNVLKHIENGVLNSTDYAYIKGEALGLRAFIHFDILRLFAKTYKYGDERGVPYQTAYSQDVPPTATIKKTCELIINDLLAAEELLKDNLELYDPNNKDKDAPKPDSEYYKEQTIHFNIYAVKATLARVYLYIGENKLAAQRASEVIFSRKFPLMQKTELENINCFYPNKNEAIFGLYSNRVYSDIYYTFINNTGIGESMHKIRLLSDENIKKLYEVSSFTDTHTDYRNNSYFDRSSNKATLLKRYGNKEYNAANLKEVAQGLTLIQIPEMYYIYAEASYDENPGESVNCFNTLINSRGLRNIDTINPIANKEAFLTAIYMERRKEYFGTGMMFFEAKRHHRDLIDQDGKTVVASDGLYVLPWPEAEKEYGTAN